jgi:hypothetical protein
MAKHTPGPWVVTECCDYWVMPKYLPDPDGFNGIAHCGDISWPDYERKQAEWEANARLIASAPDLLEALERLVSYAGPKGISIEEYDAALLSGRTVIAKARGEPT